MDLEKPIPPDPDIERAFDWLLAFMSAADWQSRKLAIEEHLESLLKPKSSSSDPPGFHRLVGTNDKIAWYLYLVQTSQHEPFRSEVHQASRILPVFKRLGADLDQLLKIDGIENQAKRLVSANGEPDSVIFEMLVALLWSKNGWSDVSFVPTSKIEKRPDIRAANNGEEWFIESKRLSTNSEYAQKERAKWLKLWLPLRDCLVDNNYPFVLDITFHVELETLDDDFVVRELNNKLKFVVSPCLLISNETWDVFVSFVDMDKISKHLENQYVKTHSRQLQELIGGSWDRRRGFTYIMRASQTRIGGDRGINQYVESIDWAAAAYWYCDAARSTEAKARDVRNHLSAAVEQLPMGKPGVIHVGLETPTGEDVESERYSRIVNTVAQFDAKGKDLRWVYIHLYETYSPPHASWMIDETVHFFGVGKSGDKLPLSMLRTVAADDNDSLKGVAHWQRPAP